MSDKLLAVMHNAFVLGWLHQRASAVLAPVGDRVSCSLSSGPVLETQPGYRQRVGWLESCKSAAPEQDLLTTAPWAFAQSARVSATLALSLAR